MTKPLSPAAQAVLDAYGHEVGGIAAITSYERRGIAAALRAAANQDAPHWMSDPFQDGWRAALDSLQAIAAELEGIQN